MYYIYKGFDIERSDNLESFEEKLIKRNDRLLELAKGYAEVVDQQEIEIKELKEEIIKLKKQNGGRPRCFNDKQKEEIIKCRADGKTVKAIAEQFNCSMSTINRILSSVTL